MRYFFRYFYEVFCYFLTLFFNNVIFQRGGEILKSGNSEWGKKISNSFEKTWHRQKKRPRRFEYKYGSTRQQDMVSKTNIINAFLTQILRFFRVFYFLKNSNALKINSKTLNKRKKCQTLKFYKYYSLACSSVNIPPLCIILLIVYEVNPVVFLKSLPFNSMWLSILTFFKLEFLKSQL